MSCAKRHFKSFHKKEFAELFEAGFTDIIVRNMASDQGQALGTIEALSDVKRQLRL